MGCGVSCPERKEKVVPIKNIDHVTEPVFADAPFSVRLPAPPKHGPRPLVRGLPMDAQLLSHEEKAELLGNLAGKWCLEPAGIIGLEAHVGDDGSVSYLTGFRTQVFMERHPGQAPKRHARRIPVYGLRHKLHFSRGASDGVVYCDLIGSMFTRLDFALGELDFENALGLKLLWVSEERRQKRDRGARGEKKEEAPPALEEREEKELRSET